MGFVDTLPLIMESMSHFFKIAALRMDAFIFEMGGPGGSITGTVDIEFQIHYHPLVFLL